MFIEIFIYLFLQKLWYFAARLINKQLTLSYGQFKILLLPLPSHKLNL